ncbi:MAG: right-handed parallel beta-helix repeat-containing protein [Bdellovibrionota bacterium]|nr:MAG: right-handed parallel beta-helix repeat-containing protein [Bdellovibrionota bacterium]
MRFPLLCVVLLCLMCSGSAHAQAIAASAYDMGSPQLDEYYVDPLNGDDSNDGLSSGNAFRTIQAAWNTIPQGAPLSRGVRINLLPGSYAESAIPNYWESRYGTFAAPIILQASGGPSTAILQGDINAFDLRYFYLIDIDIEPDPPGDALHFEQSDHILLRGVRLDGGNREAHETLKINQSQYIYIEDSEIHGAGDNAIDFVAVQYGHILRNRIHDAADWCMYVKGGSAYLLIEANRLYDCGTGGFTAGQGTGFEFMTSPWLHYEAYDIKFINNIIHDTEGAGMGVNGGYNVLLAHNTLYRVGSRSHTVEVVYGLRSCDGDASACATRVSAGGWGTSSIGTEGEPIGNRNVYVINNLIFNPSPFQSADQHFAIYGPRTPNGGTNLASPQRTDDNLVIRGNYVHNGPEGHPLGVGDGQGCGDSNPTCNAAQLNADNTVSTVVPALRDPENGDFRPQAEGNILALSGVAIPDFSGGDRPSPPASPAGVLENTVLRDRSGATRAGSPVIGAYATSDAAFTPDDEDEDSSITIRRPRCTPRPARQRQRIRCTVVLEYAAAISEVTLSLSGRTTPMRSADVAGRYRGRTRAPAQPGIYSATVSVTAVDAASESETFARAVRVIR